MRSLLTSRTTSALPSTRLSIPKMPLRGTRAIGVFRLSFRLYPSRTGNAWHYGWKACATARSRKCWISPLVRLLSRSNDLWQGLHARPNRAGSLDNAMKRNRSHLSDRELTMALDRELPARDANRVEEH